MEESSNYTPLVERVFLELIEDTDFIEEWQRVSVFSNVSSKGEVEIERKLVKKLNGVLANKLADKKLKQGIMCLSDLKGKSEEFYSLLVLAAGHPPEFTSLGKLSYKVVDRDEELDLIFTIQMKERERQQIKINLSEKLPVLYVEEDKEELENIFEPEPKLVLVDFEWINYFKSEKDKSTTPEQVSEYAIMAEGCIYNSDYLKVESEIVKKIHKKLLDKQGVTKEILLERHKNGVTMYDEYKHNMVPLLERSKAEGKLLTFVFFGREDGVILKQLFPEDQWEYIKLVDFTQLYHIIQLGQESILKGLGVKFLHTFDSAMDVRALNVILEVFRAAKTVDDSKNLQNAILVQKMISASDKPERVEKYQKLLMNHSRTRELFEQALDLVDQYEKEGYFGVLSEFLWE